MPLASDAGRRYVDVSSRVSIPLRLDPDAADWELFAINDDGLMIGVGKTTNGEPVVIRVLPHDTDNDGVPDYRKIVDPYPAGDLDTNDNWVLDSAETFRPGLYATGRGLDGRSPEVANTDVFRLHFDQFDLDAINDNLDDECDHTDELFGNYHDVGYSLVMLRHRYAANSPEDTIPLGTERTDFLNDVRNFFFRFGSHVDYFQPGNEIISGIGIFKFDMADDAQYEDWFVPGRNGVGTVKEVIGTHLETACEAIMLFQSDVAQAALEGCVRGGHRPVRLVGPATPSGVFSRGYSGDPSVNASDRESHDEQNYDPNVDEPNRAAFAAYCTILQGNRYADYADVHLHYDSWGQFDEQHDLLFDANASWVLEGADPEQVSCTEWGPRPTWDQDLNEGWWPDNDDEVVKYYEDGSGTPFYTKWNDFITDDWQATDLGFRINNTPDDDFYLEEVVPVLEADGYVFGLYGGYVQTGSAAEPDVFIMPAIWADKIKDAYLDDPVEPTDRFTPFKGWYEAATTGYSDPNFDHGPTPPDPCGLTLPWPN